MPPTHCSTTSNVFYSYPSMRPQLEVRDLELVLALSECGSTASAGALLHLTQSAVSRALTQAEERVGARLFERGSRGVVPTAAGQRLLAGAARVLDELRELERLVSTPAAPMQRLIVVCECYTAYHWLPSAVLAMRDLMPDLELRIDTRHTRDPVRGLLDSKLDVALLTSAQLPKTSAGSGLAELPLFSDEVVFLVSPRHRLARAKHITPNDLRTEQLITSNAPAGEAAWFTRNVFGRRSPKLSYLLFPLTEAVVDATRAGMGVAVLSEWMASQYVERGELLIKRLPSGALRRPWRLAYRRSAGDAALRLQAVLARSAPRLRPGPTR
jgi:LysR family transcriptional regulator, regulator for metE and metH